MNRGKEDRVTQPIAIGTGLVALDVVVGIDAKDSPRVYAGGTCGNVLSILGYFGWRSLPVARLGDEPADRVFKDLERFGVDLKYAKLTPTAPTPIIVERIRRDSSGELYHSFSWSCPQCKSRLPGYAPVPAAAITPHLDELPPAGVFFFDRVSRGAITLAKAAQAKGAIVFFEPSGVGEPRLFREALTLAHVVKYSQERMKTLGEWFDDEAGQPSAPLLEIETLGRGGLRYRTRLPADRTQDWRHVDAYPVPTLRDAAGCGDWTTAGIIDKIARNGLAGLRRLPLITLASAVRYGQALAAWNCGYEGARGGMYHLSSDDLTHIADSIASADRVVVPSVSVEESGNRPLRKICVSCRPARARRGQRAAR